MDKSATRWIYKIARQEFWRVEGLCDLDDLVQDGFLCATIIQRRYVDPGRCKTPAHFMSLLKRTFTNYITDLSRKRTRDRAMAETMNVLLSGDYCQNIQGQDDNGDPRVVNEPACGDAEFLRTIAEAPPTVALAIRALITCDPRALQSRYRRRPNGTIETTNDRLCRIAGISPSTNLVRAIRDHLT